MKKQLFIFPYGGNAIEALDCVDENFELMGFIDDNKQKQGVSNFGLSIYPREVLEKYPEAKLSIVQASVTSFLNRKKVLDSFGVSGDKLTTLIHPSAQISKRAQIGHNCLIMANVVINAGAKIGNHVIILPNTTIHHETQINDFSWIGSNVCIAGSVKIGKQCWISSGSNIINNISIGDNCLIGLGSNVLNSFKDNTKVFGNPAKKQGAI